jgi:hypothetical protein
MHLICSILFDSLSFISQLFRLLIWAASDVNHVMTQKHAHQVPYSGTEGIFDLCMNKRLAAVTITETGLLHGGVFLMACRSLALRTNKPIYNIQALKYKGIMISITKEAIEKNTKEGTIEDTTIIKVLYLASDEVRIAGESQ